MSNQDLLVNIGLDFEKSVIVLNHVHLSAKFVIYENNSSETKARSLVTLYEVSAGNSACIL